MAIIANALVQFRDYKTALSEGNLCVFCRYLLTVFLM